MQRHSQHQQRGALQRCVRALRLSGAGVMVAASVWSLLIPAIEMAEEAGGLPGWVPAAGGFLLGAAFLLVLGFFLKRENRIAVADLRPDRHIALHALRLGLAPFGLTLLPEATVVAINVNLSMYGGEQALAAYAVVSYTACVIQMLIQGVGDGSQPLISKHYGAGDADGVRRFRNTNYLITISLGVLGLAAMYLLRNQVPLLFGASDETAGLIAYALPVFSTAYVFYGFTHASTSYFYAVDDAKASSAIVYGEALLVVLIVFGAARLFGLDGIWLSVTAVQMVLSVAAAALLRYRHRARRPDRAAEPAASEAC